MAFDAFLKIDTIEGDSSDKEHPGTIEISSFSWGETQTGNVGPGGGGGAGKVQMQDFHFTMATSKASPALMTSCATGKHFPNATLTCRKAGERQEDFMVVKLSDCIISSYSLGGDTSEVSPDDELSMAFVKIDFSYKAQKPDGSLE